MNNFHLVFLLMSLMSLANHGQGQTTVILNTDSSDTEMYLQRFQSKLQNYNIYPLVELKDSLPNGEYRVYFPMKGSRNIEDDLLIVGQYRDSLRNGRFEYYRKCGRKKRRNLEFVYTYYRGQLDGYFLYCSCETNWIEGNYKMGERDGFFFTYIDKELAKVEFFHNGVLKCFSELPDLTKIKHIGQDKMVIVWPN